MDWPCRSVRSRVRLGGRGTLLPKSDRYVQPGYPRRIIKAGVQKCLDPFEPVIERIRMDSQHIRGALATLLLVEVGLQGEEQLGLVGESLEQRFQVAQDVTGPAYALV